MHALITGADGFIGSFVTAKLIAEGFKVSALTRRPREPNTPQITNYPLNLFSPENALNDCVGADVLIHIAAQLPAPGVEPEAYFKANALATRSLTQQAKKLHIPRMLFFSSISVIGSPLSTPINSEHPVAPACDYARSKLEGEQHALQHPSCCIFRMTSPYGASMKTGSVLPLFIDRAKAGEKLFWYGQGSRRQDFIHAQDVAGACLAASYSDYHGVCVLGYGQSVSMKELTHLVRDTFGGPAPDAAPQPDAQEGVDWATDMEETSRKIGFVPSISLKQGIKLIDEANAQAKWWRE